MSTAANTTAPLQGVIAILRGVQPQEVLAVAQALVAGGVRTIEVPLNSPQPLDSLRLLAAWAREQAQPLRIGAGTVLSEAQVLDVAATGATLVLAPNFNAAVVRCAVQQGLLAMPGVATPSEGFAALAEGAHALKLFPAETLPPAAVKAWRAVFPAGAALFPVGGVGEHNLAAYRAAGAQGAGMGSSLYTPGVALATLQARARASVQAWGDDGAAVR